MPRLLPWLLFVGTLLALAVSLSKPDEVALRLGLGGRLSDRQNELWQRRLRDHYRRLDGSTPAGAVVFLGASSIQGLNASAVRSCTVSFGIGGETSAQLVDRLGDYRSLDRAAAIVVTTGLNDLLRNEGSAVGRNIDRLLAGLPAAKPVILSSTVRIPPDDRAVAIASANASMRAACDAHDGCRFVDLHGAMTDPAALTEADGIHLNPAGYALWALLLRRALDDAGVADRGCGA